MRKTTILLTLLALLLSGCSNTAPSPPTATAGPPQPTVPKFQPDEPTLLYLRDGGLRIVGLETSAELILIECGVRCGVIEARLTPDGATIAYLTSRQGEVALHLATQDGATRQVSGGQLLFSGGGFSPSGAKLVFSELRNADGQQAFLPTSIQVLDIAGSQLRELAEDRYVSPVFWMDETALLASRQGEVGPELLRLPIDGAPEVLTNGRLIAMSPDRRYVLLTPDSFAPPVGTRAPHMIAELRDGQLVPLHELQLEAGRVSWSPDGTRLVVLGTSQAELVEVASGATRTLGWLDPAEPQSALLWTDDHQHVLYTLNTNAGHNLDVLQVDLDSGTTEVLASVSGSFGVPLLLNPPLR